MQVASLSFRPQSFDAMVGQKKLVGRIRRHYAKRKPNAWLFLGPTGVGKTTLARIMAVSVQCRHQETFGSPCQMCIRKRKSFDIYEINAGDITGIDALRQALSSSDYEPRPGSRRRVYILDEAQGLSNSAQTLLLKYLEDCPPTTIFILCTTDPHKIFKTIQSRCMVYPVPALNLKSVRVLVRRVLRFFKSELDSGVLVDALNEKGISSPRLIVNAVEKYAAGCSPDEAARVQADSEVDVHALCRAVIKGAWADVAKYLRDAQPTDAIVIKISVASYLRTILQDEDDFSKRATVVADAIESLVNLRALEDTMQLAGLGAVLFRLCKWFNEYKR